jgi:hypothetical protein
MKLFDLHAKPSRWHSSYFNIGGRRWIPTPSGAHHIGRVLLSYHDLGFMMPTKHTSFVVFNVM